MEITNILKTVLLDVKATGHEAVLEELTARLLPEELRGENGKVFCDLRDHETIEGALSGTGSAIFHCLSEHVTQTLLAVAITRTGLRHRGKKEPVRIFFLVISPIKESGSHLQLLSNLEGVLHNRAFQSDMLRAKSPEDAGAAIQRVLKTSKSAYIPLGKDDVFRELKTSGEGLSEAEARERLGLTGPNALKKVVRGALVKDFFYNMFFNLFALLLWAGGAMSFIAGTPELGWAIFIVIVINASFSFLQEYKAERAVEALERLLPKKVVVRRGGKDKEIDAADLVPGDLTKIGEGDSIPADGRLIVSEDMRVDNSSLTGESRPVYKVSEPLTGGKGFIWAEMPNMVFAGTTVHSGTGAMVVTATGMDTEIGKVAYLTQKIKTEQSPLQKEIAAITRTITVLAVTLGAAFFLVGHSLAGLTFAESFIFAIGIIVANVPEGLLPTVSLSLAMGVQRMAGKNAMVKKLSAVETLGSATVICTDKTGTLTTNEMCVKFLYVNETLVDVAGDGYSPAGDFTVQGKALGAPDLKEMGVTGLLTAAALCNNARLIPPSQMNASWTVSGDPTEGALLTAAQKAGIDLSKANEKNPRIAHLAFERIRKRMATVHTVSEGGRQAVCAYVKGAPKEVLSLCSTVLRGGRYVEMTESDRERILRENDVMASRGLRILAVAMRPIERKKSYTADEVERELAFTGLIAMIDPPRSEVKQALESCRGAGIKVVMLTGDYGITAKAIADGIGLRTAAPVITGEELNGITQEELKELLKKGAAIFARVAPKDKLRVVAALQENGEVVAVTGDGVNDAPALKKADIGIAMGLRGSDVAKEAAEIVLADDNFKSIVDAVKEGRAVYANIKKFVTYILTHNVAELVPVIAFVVFRIPLPLTVMQMLAIDLGSDIFPALGLGAEPPESGVMNLPPRPRTKRLLDLGTLKRVYLFLGPIEAVLGLAAFFYAYWIRGWVPGAGLSDTGLVYASATTMCFAGIVASQIGNVFACRAEIESAFTLGFFKNRFILGSIVLEIIIGLALIYTPALERIFGFAPLGASDLAILAVFPPVVLGASELRKAAKRWLFRG